MSRIQINLLPDIKQEFERARRTRNLIITLAVLVTAGALALFLFTFTAVDVVQKQQLSGAGKSLEKANTKLKAVPNLAQITTIQNQLQSLVTLHQGKQITSRIFTYLPQVTPSSVSIAKLDIDASAEGGTMTIGGNADSQATVNTFIDTLKNTTYKVGSNDSAHNTFPSVVESNFTINPSSVSFTLDVQFDLKLLANNLLDNQGKAQVPVLSVSKLTTTKSVLDDPSNVLFKAPASTGGTQ